MGRQSDRIGEQLEREVGMACKALILQIDRNLRRSPGRGGTPVDTGHARANWIPSIGTPTVLDTSVAQANAAHQQGVQQVISFKLGDGVLYVSNGTPYIRKLNEGWSEQAARLFVESCVDEAYATVEGRLRGRIQLGRSAFQDFVGSAGAENLADAYNPFGGDDD